MDHPEVGVDGGNAGIVGMENDRNSAGPEGFAGGSDFCDEFLIHFSMNQAGVDAAIFKNFSSDGSGSASTSGVAATVPALPAILCDGNIRIRCLNGTGYLILQVKYMSIKRGFDTVQHVSGYTGKRETFKVKGRI